ncbi:hypothetical protein HWV62_9677 [Athelia sp. TMB]|nr:hypothetical protein HWV62_9677 [Athelia sp. TMB]
MSIQDLIGTCSISNVLDYTQFFDTAVTQYSIYEPLLYYSSPRTIFTFGLTCKAGRVCVLGYYKSAFNINKHLSRFLPNPKEFRGMQARTGTVISGSNAVQFMDRAYYQNADLDVFVDPGYCAEVGQHMIITQGYRITNPSDGAIATAWTREESLRHITDLAVGPHGEPLNPPYAHGSVHLVAFMQRTTEAGKTQDAQLIVASDSAFHAILDFHSTCVMNFIAFDRAIALYPLATFENRINQVMGQYTSAFNRDESVEAALAKYQSDDRGFPMRTTHSAEESRLLFQHGIDRKVGDRWCWTVKFDMVGIEARQPVVQSLWPFESADGRAPVVPDSIHDPIMENKWQMSGPPGCLALKYCIIGLPIFKYAYAVADVREALRARKSNANVVAVRERHGRTHSTWYDNIVSAITRGDLSVNKGATFLDESEESETAQYQDENRDHWPGCGFPMKVTDKDNAEKLAAKVRRYIEACAYEEIGGVE